MIQELVICAYVRQTPHQKRFYSLGSDSCMAKSNGKS